MSEFELEYLLTETGLAAIQTFGMFVTVTSAYLVAAYLAGRRLTRLQAIIVSTLYLVAALIMTWATVGYITRSIPVADALELMHPDRLYALQPPVRVVTLVLMLGGIFASLKFMWDIRKAPEE